MNFKPQIFAENIESKYVTSYGAEVGEVICHIFDKDKNESDFDNFINNIKKSDFFDLEKISQDSLKELEFEFAKRAITSSIIKECKYNEHFMTWNEGTELTQTFFKEFNGIKKIYTNSYWENIFEDNLHKDELDMTGWDNFSLNYWYDYGFLVISNEKIGFIWFGDES